MAQYPSTVSSFSTKLTGDTIAAAHPNEVQTEITALTDALLNGIAHNLKPSTTNVRDLGTTGLRWKDLYLSGNSAITGTVTAGQFVGGGAGLTGVPAVLALDGLTDVTAPAPVNGQFLKWNGSAWINATLPAGATGATIMDELLDADTTTVVPVSGDLLKFNGTNWVPAAIGGFSTGDVKWTLNPTIPAGWLNQNGQAVSRATYAALFAIFSTTYGAGDGSTTFNLPSAVRRVPLGKADSGGQSTLGDTGGAFDHTHTGPSHTHAVGTLAVASHNHSVGTLAVDSHTHAAGTLAVANHTHGAGSLAAATHTHTMAGPTAESAGAHTHGISGGIASDGAHTHNVTPVAMGVLYDGGSQEDPASTASVATDSQGAHTHGLGTLAIDSDGSHTHTLTGSSADYSGALAVTGTSDPTAPALSGSVQATAPAVTGNTAAIAPALSGATAAEGTGATGANNPAYMVMLCLVKT